MNKFRERQVSMSQQHDKDKVKQCSDVQKASGAVWCGIDCTSTREKP